MTSNHTQSKQFSFTASVCRDVACNVSMREIPYFYVGDVARYVSTSDSPRFAVLPQYVINKRTKPSISRTCDLADDFQWIPALQREIEDLSKITSLRVGEFTFRRSQWSTSGLTSWRRRIPAYAGMTHRRISKITPISIPLSLRKGILLSQPSSVFHRLLTPFLSQPIAKHDVCMMEPNRYLRLMLAAKAGGLPQAGSCSFNSKYLLLIN